MTKFRLGATMSNTPKTEQDYFQQSKELTNEQEKEITEIGYQLLNQ